MALEPHDRTRPRARGTPVAIIDRTWLLADYVPKPDDVWDRLFDQNALSNRYDHVTLRQAGLRLLDANYDLTPDEAVGLIRAADLDDLVTAVEAALFGPAETDNTYSDWVKVSLWSNNINPAAVPPEDRRDVLDYLVRVGRAVPASDYVSSAEAAKVRGALLGMIQAKAADE
jgi:hypothetical protein